MSYGSRGFKQDSEVELSYLEVQDDSPNEAQSQLRVAINNVFRANID